LRSILEDELVGFRVRERRRNELLSTDAMLIHGKTAGSVIAVPSGA